MVVRKTMNSRLHSLAALLLKSSVFLSLSAGCTTNSFCFDDCGDDAGASGGGGGIDKDGPGIEVGGGGSDGGIIIDSAADGCVPTNNGVEKCDGLDNNCNGQIDENADFTKVTSCGTCKTNCAAPPHIVNPKCDPPATLDGKTPGKCSYDKCEQDWYDINKNPADGLRIRVPMEP